MFSRKLAAGVAEFSRSVESLVAAEAFVLGQADPPNLPGVYAFMINDKHMYVGEAKGSGGLYDRIMRKHVSGDEGHALQHYFKVDFPDRVIRRDHIMGNVQVKWVIVEDLLSVAVVERLAIWLLEPPLNRK
jgi:hypothetical protein